MVRLSNPPLFTIDELEDAYLWVCDIRKDYSPNSDIWELRRNWANIKDSFLGLIKKRSEMFLNVP